MDINSTATTRNENWNPVENRSSGSAISRINAASASVFNDLVWKRRTRTNWKQLSMIHARIEGSFSPVSHT